MGDSTSGKKRMGRPPLAPGVRPTMNVAFPEPLRTQIDNYHRSCGVERFAQDTIRELIALGLSSDPDATVRAAARQTAFKQAHAHIVRRFSNFLEELREEVAQLAYLAELDAGSDDRSHS